MLQESSSGRRAALEITSFGWPLDVGTVLAWVRFVRDQLVKACSGAIQGSFALSIDLMEIRERRLLSPRNRRQTVTKLVEWFRTEAASMRSDTFKTVGVIPGLAVSRNTDSGPLQILASSLTSIDFGQRIKDLESVIRDNARKFEGLQDVRRWLLIPFPGAEDVLSITGPVIE